MFQIVVENVVLRYISAGAKVISLLGKGKLILLIFYICHQSNRAAVHSENISNTGSFIGSLFPRRVSVFKLSYSQARGGWPSGPYASKN